MPHEHEVPGLEAELWRDSKQRLDDALGPAAGIALATLIAMLIWTLLAWVLEHILLTAPG